MLRYAALAALLLVGGCGANHNAIYRTFSSEIEVGEEGKTVKPNLTGFIIDAKQRAMIAKHDSDKGYIYCVEPSPDAFSVLSSSFAASGQLSKNTTDATAAGQLARAMNETGSTISRTQTIQILREAMYRTCERYANGGMDEEEMYVQSIRDQRMIVSVLAIEQLTGSVIPPAVAISATAEADTGKTALEAQENLDTARAKLKASEKDKATADDLAKKAEAAKEKSGLKEKQAKDAEDSTGGDAGKVKAAKELRDEATKSKGEADAAAEVSAKQKPTLAEATRSVLEYEDLVKSTEEKRDAALAVSASGAAQIKFGNCESCRAKPPSDATIVKVADTVKAIVDKTFTLDEVELRCLRIIGRDKGEEAEKMVTAHDNIKLLADEKSKTLATEALAAKVDADTQYLAFCMSYFKSRKLFEDVKAKEREVVLKEMQDELDAAE